MMPGYTTLPLRADDCAFCPTLKADSSRSVYLRAGVAPRVGSVEPEPADSEKAEEEERPEHVPCHPLDKVWLPTYPDENTQDALHTWCTDTGTVRNQGGEEARPRGFWVTVLYRLQRRLENPGPLADQSRRLLLATTRWRLARAHLDRARMMTPGTPDRAADLVAAGGVYSGLHESWLGGTRDR